MAGFDYRTAPVSLKIAASAFLLLAVIGLGIAGLQIYVRTGMTPGGTLMHYRGDEATMQYPQSFGAMVDTAHAHAFTMPLLALALSIAILLSKASETTKRVIVSALFAGMVLELGLPWLVRYGPAWTVHLFDLTGILLGGGLLVAAAIPLYEMWIAA